MAKSKEIELADGTKVRVHIPPTQQIIAMVEKKYPKPQVPIVTDTNVTGREISMRLPADPDYLAALAEWEAITTDEINRRSALFIFKDLVVPDDWDAEAIGAIIRLDEPDWQPTPGELGRKRDYIQWELLNNSQDALLVQQTLAELSGIDLSEVQANEASFRPQVEGEASQ
jgi:hypothetical protein